MRTSAAPNICRARASFDGGTAPTRPGKLRPKQRASAHGERLGVGEE